MRPRYYIVLLFCLAGSALALWWLFTQRPGGSAAATIDNVHSVAESPISEADPDPDPAVPAAPEALPNKTNVTISRLGVRIDPATGKPFLGNVPLSPELENAISTSSEGLQEVPSPGGGTMVDLQGRFRTIIAVKITTNGRNSNETSK
jgi:hypothetical protein